ncbi:MAG: hypothetical protein ACT4QG_21090 [Sporichthyaceae bacterium]
MSTGWDAGVSWRFVQDDDGGIALILEPPYPLFHEAFAEAVGPWAVVGGDEVLSTYWVDRLIERLEDASAEPGVERVLAEASGAELYRLDDRVIARDAIFDVPDENLAAAEVLPALYAWRQQLLLLGASSEAPDPEQG